MLTAGAPVLKISVIDLYHRRTNPKFLTTQLMIVFSVVTGVGQQSANGQMLSGLSNRRFKIVTIGARPAANYSRDNQMTLVFTNRGQLCPSAIFGGSAALTLKEVPADVMVFHTGRVNTAGVRAGGFD